MSWSDKKDGAPERIRISDLLNRNQMLYPAELRAHIKNKVVILTKLSLKKDCIHFKFITFLVKSTQ